MQQMQRYLIVRYTTYNKNKKKISEELLEMEKRNYPILLEILNQKFPIPVYQFIQWCMKLTNYQVMYSDGQTLTFGLVEKDFSLLVQIALARNGFSNMSELSKYNLILEVHYIVAVKKGLGVGSNFLKEFKKLANSIHTPIILFCEETLMKYYENNEFIYLCKNNLKQCMMCYFVSK